MPAVTQFGDGTGPVFAGKLFPFAFITIACGAISGFHALISSGTTPKMLSKESHARMIGYGGMLMESFVGVMAMIAACVLDPGVFFAINAPPGVVGGTLEAATTTISNWGFVVTPEQMRLLAQQTGETTLLGRTLHRNEQRKKPGLVGGARILLKCAAKRNVLRSSAGRKPRCVGRKKSKRRFFIAAVFGEVEVHASDEIPRRILAFEEILERKLRFLMFNAKGGIERFP